MSNAYLLNPASKTFLPQFMPEPALLVAYGQCTIEVASLAIAVPLTSILAGDLVYVSAASGGAAGVELVGAAVAAGVGFTVTVSQNVAGLPLVYNYQVFRAN